MLTALSTGPEPDRGSNLVGCGGGSGLPASFYVGFNTSGADV